MSDRYNYPRADYPLLQGIRLRREILAWGLGLTAWGLLLGSTLLVEERDRSLHWARTLLIGASLPIAALGRLAVEDAHKAGRVMLDYEDVTDAGRQQLLWQETTDHVEAGAEDAAPVDVADAWDYLGQPLRNGALTSRYSLPPTPGKVLFSTCCWVPKAAPVRRCCKW